MKNALWTALAVVFGIATLVAIGNGIHTATSSNPGPQSRFGVTTGIGDAILQIAFIAALGLATRACWRRAERSRSPRRLGESIPERRPWER